MSYILLFFVSLTICSESLEYKVKYNNIKAGSALFNEKILSRDSINYKQISFSVKSSKIVDIFYKLRTEVSMIVDTNEYYIYDLNKNLKEGKNIEKSYSIIDYNNKIISYDNKNIIFNGEKVYSILSLIYFLRNQDLGLNQEYFINIYNNGVIKPAIAQVIEKYNHTQNIIYSIISVKSTNNNQNHMTLVISESNNIKIPIQFELYTKNGVMELSIDD